MPQVIGLWNTNISKVISNSNALVPMDIDVDSNDNGNEVQSCITNMLHLLETSNIIDKSDVTTETGKSKTTKSKKVKKEREKRGLYYAHASVKVKTLADLIESVIGAFYIQGGLSAAIGVIRAIGAWPLDNVQLHEQIPTKTVCRYQPPDIPLDYPPELSRIACGLSMNISTKDYDCGHELSSVTINELQAKLGYRFRNILYLEEALTHCSWQGKPSNQRLEFLGDAVLDFAVVDFIYKNRPSYLDQGKLTNIKCTSTSNKRLATLAVRLEMYKYMLVMSSSLIGQFGDIETWKETCANRAPADTFLDLYEYDMSISDDIENIAENSGGTKALADVVEAIFGAVFIDSNCSFSTIVELVQRLHIVSTFTEN
jgi:dsRNA-specific ribonuclease